MWKPSTFEDKLLMHYLEKIQGKLYLEVPLWFSSNPRSARKIDGLLIPGEQTEVFPQGDYAIEEVKNEIEDQTVHLLEAKRSLDRFVIGQVLVGASLLEHVFSPAKVIKVAVCGEGNPDLEWYCNQNQIRVELFPSTAPLVASDNSTAKQKRIDYRQPPDSSRYRAFLAGWTNAVKGNLYASVHHKKTHANMGNLFGWIYGEQPIEFKKATWERYLLYANVKKEDNELD